MGVVGLNSSGRSRAWARSLTATSKSTARGSLAMNTWCAAASSSIIGFGAYHYRYASGHEGDAPLVGFSPRKANLVFYLSGCEERRDEFLGRLGKHKAGKGCVYVNRLGDVDAAVLKEMAAASAASLRARYSG